MNHFHIEECLPQLGAQMFLLYSVFTSLSIARWKDEFDTKSAAVIGNPYYSKPDKLVFRQ